MFSKVDLFSAFHNIVIEPSDVEKTTTLTPWGVYVYKRLAFGLSGAPSTFMKMVDSVLDGVEDVYAYLDDFLVFSMDEESHYKTLQTIFQRLKENGLAIKLSKCEFGRKSVEFLGYEVSKEGIRPLNRKIQALVDFPSPRNQKDLLHFLGALNYFRNSLKGLKKGAKYENPAEIMQVLFNLATCKIPNKTKFLDVWNQDPRIQDAFKKCKDMLVKATVLTHPDPQAELRLCTDSSECAVGGSLEQKGSDGKFHPLGFSGINILPRNQ